MLKLAATLLAKVRRVSQLLSALVDASNRAANSMLHCGHSETYQHTRTLSSSRFTDVLKWNATDSTRYCYCTNSLLYRSSKDIEVQTSSCVCMQRTCLNEALLEYLIRRGTGVFSAVSVNCLPYRFWTAFTNGSIYHRAAAMQARSPYEHLSVRLSVRPSVCLQMR